MITADLPILTNILFCRKKGKSYKYFSWLSASVFLLSWLYDIGLGGFFFSFMNVNLSFAFFLQGLFSGALWYSISFQERRIKNLVRTQNNLLPRPQSNKLLSSKEACLLMFLTITHIASSIFKGYYLTRMTTEGAFLTFNYCIQNDILEAFIGTITVYASILISTKWPCIALWSLCQLLRRTASVIKNFEAELKRVDLSDGSVKTVEQLKKYFATVRVARLTKEAVSKPSLVVIMTAFSTLYLLLAESLLNHLNRFEPIHLHDFVFMGSMSCVEIIVLTYYCAEIPDSMLKLRTTAEELIEKQKLLRIIHPNSLIVLERIEKKDAVYMTGGDLFVFTYSFVLTAFGSLLTFGLLIFNLNKTDKGLNDQS